jgi:hypothetical protein
MKQRDFQTAQESTFSAVLQYGDCISKTHPEFKNICSIGFRNPKRSSDVAAEATIEISR